MTILRIGAPNGEQVIEGNSIENRQLFDLIAGFGWLVEERRKEDRVKIGGHWRGWRGTPIRAANSPNEIVKTRVIGHREPRYLGEPKSRREIVERVDPADWISREG